jgi:hypothetical protein
LWIFTSNTAFSLHTSLFSSRFIQTTFNTTTMSDDDDDDAEAVEPTNKDVLFGRGGMTKHHKGNAWFRNLMKENRLLYLESPKHHKLQLVEQIVDYILSKDCRFLQKKHSARPEWYPVSYKRAVVKTSQAFRDAHRYDKTQKTEQIHGVSQFAVLAKMDPVTLQQHLMRSQLEMYQKPPVGPVPSQRSVVLLPPPSEKGARRPDPPVIILSKPKRPAAEYYKKKKSTVLPQEPPVERSVVPIEHSVARQMVALLELAERDRREQEYAAYNSARIQAAAQASAPTQQPVSILARLPPRPPERVPPVEKYHARQYDPGAKKEQPLAPTTQLKDWSALNKVLDRRVEQQNEDDQFADADEEVLFPPAACAS